jgi:glycosyltransferase involved in cell wall biosynthesis
MAPHRPALIWAGVTSILLCGITFLIVFVIMPSATCTITSLPLLDNHEILIIDDKSLDSSVDVVQNMMAADSRIRMVRHTENRGTHASRISGVLHAQGTFILSLDADDEIYPWIAEDALHCALLHKVDMVEFHVLKVGGGRVKQFNFLNPPMVHAAGAEIATSFGNQQLNWNIWKRLVKREVYIKALNILTPSFRGKRLIYAEDKLHVGLICLIANGLFFLKEPGYIYYTDIPGNSASGTQQTKEECLRQLRFVERALKYFYQAANRSYTPWNLIPLELTSE